MNGFKYFLSLLAFFILSTSHVFANDAADDESPSYYELILMGGVAELDAETHTLENNQTDWDAWQLKVGAGYVFGLSDDNDDPVEFFTSLRTQFNFYYLTGDFDSNDYKGDEINFQSPRFMFDLGLTLVRLGDFSLYTLAGAGVALNEFDEKDSTGVAYEFGAGLTYAVLSNMAISAEYLYVGLNNVEIPENIHQEQEIDINSQSVLVGLRFVF